MHKEIHVNTLESGNSVLLTSDISANASVNVSIFTKHTECRRLLVNFGCRNSGRAEYWTSYLSKGWYSIGKGVKEASMVRMRVSRQVTPIHIGSYFSVFAKTYGRPCAISPNSYNVKLPVDCENDRVVPTSCCSHILPHLMFACKY